MQNCSYCGRENSDSSAACAGCGKSLSSDAPASPISAGVRRLLISAVAAVFSFAGYLLWAGGQPRLNHLGEGLLWGTAAGIGLTSAFMGGWLAKDGKERR